MRPLLLLTISAFLYSQSITLPFDWSGQFGISSINGRLFWNTDWTSGPLLFDGTYTHYPQRYGKTVFEHFQPVNRQTISFTNYTFLDTNRTTTTLDYKRGDYNYDQLAIDLDFESPNQYAGLHLFKRSYAGREGQFFHPRGLTTPLQQSYKIDYRSENKGWLIDAAAARLVTESGLPDSGAVNGLLEDEILTAGIITSSPPEEKLQWTSQLALFQQWRRLDVSWYSNTSNQFLNRTRWQNQIKGLTFGNINPVIGLDINVQSISIINSIFREISWYTMYGQIDLKGMKTAVGLTMIDSKVEEYIAIDYSKSWGRLKIQTEYEQYSKPHHFNLSFFGEKIAHNTRSYLSINKNFESSIISLIAYHSSMIYNDEKYELVQAGITGSVKLFDHFSFSGSYFSSEGESLLFDGFQKRTKFYLKYQNDDVFNRFTLQLQLSGEGLLNKEQSTSFNPIDGFSYKYHVFDLEKPADIWLLNAEAEITISSITISWSVRNILQAIEPFALKMFPDKQKGDFLIQHHSTFPPMGRMVSFGINWTFKD